jgi:hypothetical protein
MTTSSDMGISWVEWGQTGLGKRLASLGRHPVNVVEACQSADGRIHPAAHSK